MKEDLEEMRKSIQKMVNGFLEKHCPDDGAFFPIKVDIYIDHISAQTNYDSKVLHKHEVHVNVQIES